MLFRQRLGGFLSACLFFGTGIAIIQPSSAMRMVFADDEATSITNVASNVSVLEGKFLEDGKVVIVKNGMKYNVTGQKIK